MPRQPRKREVEWAEKCKDKAYQAVIESIAEDMDNLEEERVAFIVNLAAAEPTLTAKQAGHRFELHIATRPPEEHFDVMLARVRQEMREQELVEARSALRGGTASNIATQDVGHGTEAASGSKRPQVDNSIIQDQPKPPKRLKAAKPSAETNDVEVPVPLDEPGPRRGKKATTKDKAGAVNKSANEENEIVDFDEAYMKQMNDAMRMKGPFPDVKMTTQLHVLGFAAVTQHQGIKVRMQELEARSQEIEFQKQELEVRKEEIEVRKQELDVEQEVRRLKQLVQTQHNDAELAGRQLNFFANDLVVHQDRFILESQATGAIGPAT
ncbi:hypothetical protein JAAARDRAFT_208242 [Jaapia argillacea MUCL 33604]|uniref:Uncharacterized protein n=1 Tax=Jaapia argillacea MUCL 33604 TaxID=933084 RepID=A0A067PXK2_9AGAM|nr:hypothetical protein JAAARDRAFT_208242 [Jaapia argillacea MUCL 33604]